MAHRYTAETIWHRGDQPFTDKRYSRAHLLRFDGGIEVPGSSSPLSVPLPMSIEAAVDPEEAFVSAISSCHMLWFLSIACQRGLVVDSYHDAAEGVMTRNEQGRMAVTHVTLRPRIVFAEATQPDADAVMTMHHEAHEACFIANSVKSEIVVEPRA
ncbi:MAG TPA: OsmC family protein [Aquabacterium sp.]|uniref:OsmC family protein n=1 Tax=Aquabacterium sp. TaxID=1872578 RepID=UPI002E365AF5|nr:OsmC family protein [Aquabacterium sp.]HEX5355958.1 OsmC family protein [Aquabacterium sp.]